MSSKRASRREAQFVPPLAFPVAGVNEPPYYAAPARSSWKYGPLYESSRDLSSVYFPCSPGKQ